MDFVIIFGSLSSEESPVASDLCYVLDEEYYGSSVAYNFQGYAPTGIFMSRIWPLSKEFFWVSKDRH